MRQIHDDIDEVDDGKVIEAVFVAPKLYIIVVVGKDKKTGELIATNHIRAKGIPEIFKNKLTVEDLLGYDVEMRQGDVERFDKSVKKTEEPALKLISFIKNINQKPWSGEFGKRTRIYGFLKHNMKSPRSG